MLVMYALWHSSPVTCPQIDTLIDLNCKVYVENKKIFIMQFHYCIMLGVRNLCILVQQVVHGDIYTL